MSTRLSALALLAAVTSASSAAPPEATSQSPLQLRPCTVGRGVVAECGTLTVPENRSLKAGRQIPINFIVLRASTPGVTHALYLLAGGPGQGSTSMTGTANGWMAPLRASMDMVLMDQRGTGGSNALRCETDIAANPALAFGHIMHPDVVKRCRAANETHADLTQYTTDAAVADMEELRVRLGYDRVSLYGGSYGTRIAQAYLRRHPDRTRAVVIDGVLPFDVGGPLSYAGSLQRSIDLVLSGCAGNPACQQANPRLAADLNRILKRLDEGPVKATVRPATGAPVEVTVSRGDFLYAIRGMLYGAGAPNQLPGMITAAAATGDLSEFAQRYWSRAVSMGRSIARGMHLSVLCPEDVNVLTDAAVVRDTAGTMIGRHIVDDYRAACALWPATPVARDYRTPVTARVPVLLISGQFDPVTPPTFGERIVRSLPLGKHVVGHGSTGGCPRPAALHVLEKGTLSPTSADMRRPPHQPPRLPQCAQVTRTARWVSRPGVPARLRRLPPPEDHAFRWASSSQFV